jgi:hypothetical protein
VQPPTMKNCGPPTVVRVSWKADAGVTSTNVFVVGENGSEILWTASPGPEGSGATGPWAGAGTEFVLRDGLLNKELARVKIGSAGDCK